MPKLVITGSRRGHPDLLRWLQRWVDVYGPADEAIVGDNRDTDESVDLVAWLWFKHNRAGDRARFVWRCLVKPELPSPERFYERNQRMVDRAQPGDWLLAFPDSDSRGTHDCFRRGEKRGLICKMARVVDVTR